MLAATSRLAAIACIALTLACGSSGTDIEDVRADGGPTGDRYTVEILNAGSVAISALSIQTGEDAPPLEVAQLAPGQRTAARNIGVLHENPFVIATVAGQRRTYHPVEGFSGFNPALEPGRYLIRLRWSSEHQVLETTVVATP